MRNRPLNLKGCVWPALLSVTGLSFWFFLGFPFANHNESFAWTAIIRRAGLIESLMPGVGLSRTYRPLGQLAAVGGYWLSEGRIFPVQLFNFVLAAAALAVVTCTSQQKTVTALLAALVGGTFFGGFIYLFHLHGTFYSPVLLMIPVLLWVFRENVLDSFSTDLISWSVALVAFLFHPYALMIFVAMYAGFFVRRLGGMKTQSRSIAAILGLIIVGASVVLILLAKPPDYDEWSWDNLQAWLATFRSTEIHWSLSGLAALLAGVAVLDLLGTHRTRLFAAAALAVLSGFLVWLDLPVLILWAVACLARALILSNWPLAGLIGISLFLPAVSPTGSPTYGLFALVGCIIATSFENRLLSVREDVSTQRRLALSLLLVSAVVLIVLRLGIGLPVISRFAQPLLAEREKTYQLEEIVSWWEASDYRAMRLTLYRNADNPVASSGEPRGRRFRPPTYQSYLDVYTGRPPSHAPDTDGTLLVTFGNDAIEGVPPLRIVEGPFAGPARVYLSNVAGAR